jgi:hypothetical protein
VSQYVVGAGADDADWDSKQDDIENNPLLGTSLDETTIRDERCDDNAKKDAESVGVHAKWSNVKVAPGRAGNTRMK